MADAQRLWVDTLKQRSPEADGMHTDGLPSHKEQGERVRKRGKRERRGISSLNVA